MRSAGAAMRRVLINAQIAADLRAYVAHGTEVRGECRDPTVQYRYWVRAIIDVMVRLADAGREPRYLPTSDRGRSWRSSHQRHGLELPGRSRPAFMCTNSPFISGGYCEWASVRDR